MSWALVYVLCGIGSVALWIWFSENCYDDFDGPPLMLITFLFWPTAVLLLGLTLMRDYLTAARARQVEATRVQRQELVAAEREVERYLRTGERV